MYATGFRRKHSFYTIPKLFRVRRILFNKISRLLHLLRWLLYILQSFSFLDFCAFLWSWSCEFISLFISALNHLHSRPFTLFSIKWAWLSIDSRSLELKWETATFTSLEEYAKLQSISETSLRNFWWSYLA